MKSITVEEPPMPGPSGENERRRLPTMGRLLSHAASVERAASNAFILGHSSRKRSRSRSSNLLGRSSSRAERVYPDMPYLSYQPTIGRNSRFLDLTDEQRDELGGIEYRSLKLLAKIVFSMGRPFLPLPKEVINVFFLKPKNRLLRVLACIRCHLSYWLDSQFRREIQGLSSICRPESNLVVSTCIVLLI